VTDPLAPFRDRLRAVVTGAARAVGAPEDFRIDLERPRSPEHGDLATNAALVLGGRLGRPPREIAGEIRDRLDPGVAGLDAVEVAGPGFLNFRLTDRVYFEALAEILAADCRYGRDPGGAAADADRINVEFVSANPTGPLHVAHGRGAALGDAIASLLEWTGHEVAREFYVNDAGRQIELLGESVEARYRELRGEEAPLPGDGYRGEYVRELARRLAAERGRDELDTLSAGERIEWFAGRASRLLLESHRSDLRDFGVEMDRFRSESELYESGQVEQVLVRLREGGHTYEEAGALWLATSRFGDEKDRVLVKSDGSYTYFLPDVAYHLDKAERGWTRAIDVWGADHHGHVRRMEVALEQLGLPKDYLEAVILQLVTVLRGGEEVKMSKRAGDFVTLRELLEETGVDVARYFFLMRRAEVPLSFDLDLALDRSEKNPVYKVKYAHARMCSIYAKGEVDRAGIEPGPDEFARLDTESERRLAKALLRFPEVVRTAARDRAPYRVCGYLEEIAGLVNSWYHEGNLDPSLRVLAEGATRPARLGLARAVEITLRNGLGLLGLEAPEEMVREEEET